MNGWMSQANVVGTAEMWWAKSSWTDSKEVDADWDSGWLTISGKPQGIGFSAGPQVVASVDMLSHFWVGSARMPKQGKGFISRPELAVRGMLFGYTGRPDSRRRARPSVEVEIKLDQFVAGDRDPDSPYYRFGATKEVFDLEGANKSGNESFSLMGGPTSTRFAVHYDYPELGMQTGFQNLTNLHIVLHTGFRVRIDGWGFIESSEVTGSRYHIAPIGLKTPQWEIKIINP